MPNMTLDQIRANPPAKRPMWWNEEKHGPYPTTTQRVPESDSMPEDPKNDTLTNPLINPPASVMGVLSEAKEYHPHPDHHQSSPSVAADTGINDRNSVSSNDAPQKSPPVKVSHHPVVATHAEGEGPGHWDYVEDPATDAWVKKWIPAGSGIIGSIQVSEADDDLPTPLDLGKEWDNGPGRELHAYWAHIDPMNHEKQRKQGYKPVRPEDLPPAVRARYQASEHKQLGNIIQFGDVFLMYCPKGMYEARVARQQAAQKRDEFERRQGAVLDLDDKAKSAAGSADYASVTPYQTSQSFDTRELPVDDDVAAEIASIDEANERYNAQSSGRSTFGGLTGPYDRRPDTIGPKPNWGYTPPA